MLVGWRATVDAPQRHSASSPLGPGSAWRRKPLHQPASRRAGEWTRYREATPAPAKACGKEVISRDNTCMDDGYSSTHLPSLLPRSYVHPLALTLLVILYIYNPHSSYLVSTIRYRCHVLGAAVRSAWSPAARP